jgi:hypothetical protein
VARKKNTTRQTIERDPKNPEDHLDSGYEGDSTSDEFTIPPCGIEDADVALFNLFDRDIGFTDRSVAAGNKKTAIKKPFVIFATGERFALSKRLRPPRDRNKKVMLPAISIRRTQFTQTADDITGRGINQFTGILQIKRRLAPEDKDYQNLINKLALKNIDSSVSSTRTTGSLGQDVEISHGGLLSPKIHDNMYEIITIPQPQFFTNTYEVVFWTNYTQHMNYMIETYISSFLPQVRGHQLNTDKGYWFMSYTDDSFSSQENLDDFADTTRVIRYQFNVTVRGFILAPNHETNMVPVRRWISSPVINFESFPVKDVIPKDHLERTESLQNKDKFVLSDTERDPASKQTPTTNQRYASRKQVIDPKTGKLVTKTVSILESNQKKGETVFYASDFDTLDNFIKNIGK